MQNQEMLNETTLRWSKDNMMCSVTSDPISKHEQELIDLALEINE